MAGDNDPLIAKGATGRVARANFAARASGPHLTIICVAAGVLLAIGFGGDLTASLSGVGGVAWRLGCVILVLFAWLLGAPIAKAREFVILFLPWLISCLVEAAIGTASASASDYLADAFRQIFLVAIGCSVYAIAHVRTQRDRVRLALLGAAIVTTLLSAVMSYAMVKNGWSYEAVRATKNKLIEDTGFGANSACFAGLVAALAAYDAASRFKYLILALVGFLIILSIALTARAPVGFLFISIFAAWFMARAPWWKKLGFPSGFIFGAVLIGTIVGTFFLSINWIAHSGLAKELAGRGALWQIGLSGWKGHELLGNGLRTFHDVIAANLGAGTYTTGYEQNAIYSLQGGAFHNIWVTTLVERGLFGLASMYLSYSLVIGRCVSNFSRSPKQVRFQTLLIVSFLFLRGFVELTGPMSYADEAVDAIVMIALALVMAPVPENRPVSRVHRVRRSSEKAAS